MQLRPATALRLGLAAVLVLGLAGYLLLRVRDRPPPTASLPSFDPKGVDPSRPHLREQAAAVDDLTWLTTGHTALGELSPPLISRSAVLAFRRQAVQTADASAAARANAVLAGEAFARAARVVNRWAASRDSSTGLYGRSLAAEDRAWVYQDTGADLFGHLAIGTYLLAPAQFPGILAALAAERRYSPSLPDDVSIPAGQPRGLSHQERIFGAAEYAKDGLLPAFERLGPDPWLGRLTELADQILDESAVPTRRGPIPADSAEVNGDMLQVLARLSWATGNLRYREAADRIAFAYLDVLPTTTYLPPHRWDFIENEPLERRRFRLSDHGNEIFSGLLEWHLGATLRGEQSATVARPAIRRMLDRLLDKGRNADGLWFRVLEIPSGKVDGEGLTDNYGYLLQGYLMAATIEDVAPDGDASRAERYREAVRQALLALPKYRYYDWQQGVMDGYADAVESAIYLLNARDDTEADAWVDEQVAVLYGFQAADGMVSGEYLDGNFIRSALLYGFTRTSGLRLDPWSEDVLFGAARDGACLAVSLSSRVDWTGRLLFDSPRFRLHLNLPLDYARLNKWPEWFVADDAGKYRLEDSAAQLAGQSDGGQLAGAGLDLRLKAGPERQLRICPAAA